MNRTLLGLLFRRHRWTCLACMVPPVFVGVVIGWLWPRLSQEAEALRSMLGFLEDWFGGDLVDMFTTRGFFQIPFQHPLTLLSFAVGVGLPALSLPAGERGRGGLDLLLSTPLERRPLIHTVLLFQAFTIPFLAFAPWIGTWAGASISGIRDDIDFGTFALVSVQAAFLIASMASAATLVSSLSSERNTMALGFGSFLLLGLMLRVLAEFWREGEWISKVTPFGWYEPPRIVASDQLEPLPLLVLAGFTLACAVAASQVAARRRRA